MRRVWVLVAVLVLFGTAAGSGSAMSPAPVVAQTTPASGLCDTAGVEQFTDIADGDYGAAYMLCMRALGLSRGMGDGSYGADDDLDRAQMASFLVRLWRDVLGNPCPTGVVSPFTDVSDDNYAAGDIECVYGLELTKGTTATTYGPWDDLEAWQITLFLYRTLNKTNNTTCAPGSGSELELATACLLQLHVVPSQTEATASTTVTRAQMGVYIVGLWHNLAGKGLPPTPPQLPTTQQSTPTTTQPADDCSGQFVQITGSYDDALEREIVALVTDLCRRTAGLEALIASDRPEVVRMGSCDRLERFLVDVSAYTDNERGIPIANRAVEFLFSHKDSLSEADWQALYDAVGEFVNLGVDSWWGGRVGDLMDYCHWLDLQSAGRDRIPLY